MAEQGIQTGVFINGKNQIIEMLQVMNDEEKRVLLGNIHQRNSALALELMYESISFNDLAKCSKHDFLMIANQITPLILGVALKGASQDLQKRVLSSMPREAAQEAYKILTTPIGNEARDVPKAQGRVKESLIALKKKGQLSF